VSRWTIAPREPVPARPLRSGALARKCGVSADTLRFYERRGLLRPPPRDPSGYRRYPAETIDRVRLIRSALDAGFSIDELARILAQRDAGGAPCREVLAIASARLAELTDRIARLTALRDRLETAVADWRRQLARTPAQGRARLLDRLGEQLAGCSARTPPMRRRPSAAR
jgi:DNA-binding transcriptional MerR regulator